MNRLIAFTALCLPLGLLFGVAKAADPPPKHLGIHCTNTAAPRVLPEATERGIYGEVQTRITVAEGEVRDVEFVSGDPIFSEIIRATLARYRCEKLPAPFVLMQTFEFPDITAPRPKNPYGLNDPRRTLYAANETIKYIFPTRPDVLVDLSSANASKFTSIMLLKDVRPDLDPRAAKEYGDWEVKVSFIVEADGSVRDMVTMFPAPPAAIERVVFKALQESTYRPATYDGTPIPSPISRSFSFKIK